MIRKAILLAGGAGTRLFPMTQTVSKHLLPVYDKPLIYYPLSVLMLAGIREVLIITSPDQSAMFKAMLGSGEQWGIRIEYAVQEAPNGLAEAFLIGESFLGGEPACLILGDNMFYGADLPILMEQSLNLDHGAKIFAYLVDDPRAYGVVSFGPDNVAIDIEEKPEHPKSNYAVPGIYFYDHRVTAFAKTLQPSVRGELEITDLNRRYLDEKQLKVDILGRGIAWFDTGTPDSLLDATNFVATIEKRQGQKIACLEEISLRKGFVDPETMRQYCDGLGRSQYIDYVRGLLIS